MQTTMWGEVLAKLEKRINRPSFNTWIRPTQMLSMNQKKVNIGVPDDVFVYWLGEHYVNVIVDTLTETLGFQPEIFFVVMENAVHAAAVPETENIPRKRTTMVTPSQTHREVGALEIEDAGSLSKVRVAAQPDRLTKTTNSMEAPAQPWAERIAPRRDFISRVQGHDILASLSSDRSFPRSDTTKNTNPDPPLSQQHQVLRELNPAYTFDSYVVGDSNRLAHDAALSVAAQMAANYNPLFIYGGVGLGKTHLLHAIGNHLSNLAPKTKILYLSAEQFMNEMVLSIREDRMARFREKYRNIDLLLVDDIQFIARKERTQEEFFHTFNTLYQARKQIILTSDCPPKKIPTIAEQLRSRFEWGLIADIQAPDLEMRIEILKKKAASQQIVLPDDVAAYIAKKIHSTIRELEGCLAKIRAYSTFAQQQITLELAQKVLYDLFDTTPRKITVELVQQVVANHYQVDLSSMKSSTRSRKLALPRQIAMYLARELTNLSLSDIVRYFGGRDHTTVMYACRKVEQAQANDKTLREKIIHIRALIIA
ncbi:chromosomal replication initiator protein dnaA [Candidatus Vecturithrix granuli]|uniref:Chromosomal replication initiator protein DnaA n=1 Tax=Vecturithrix granuli TaxID=1499967 RepID=A0A081C611_VECG1|nr:chromosomal replication initiator protein dnaA [Candidatus Vecturithrix granuli]